MFNSTFYLTGVGNDFDPLARVVRIDEVGNIGYTHPAIKQTLCYLDHSSLESLRDAIDEFLVSYTLPVKEAFEWQKKMWTLPKSMST
jgi:hypothetical protein